MKKRLFIGTFLLMLLLAMSTARAALADPTGNPNTFTATLQCGSGTVTFVVLPAASPTLLDLNSSGGFHLTQVDFTIVETGVSGTVPYGAGNGQANGVQDDLVTCFVTEIRDGLTFEFALTGFFTPQ
jgi:hypothetical protein